MYAVIEAQGHQYKVSEGDILVLPRVEGKAGESVEFPKVLLLSRDEAVSAGSEIQGAKVVGRILRQYRGRKIRVARFRRRKNWARTRGHRANLTSVRVEKILLEN